MLDREVTGTINKDGVVTFDEEIIITEPQAVTIIFKTTEQNNKHVNLKTQQELTDKIIQGLHEAITGRTVPLSALWDEVDAD
jgi:aromatic ring-opening dioxygenase LigB subunit